MLSRTIVITGASSGIGRVLAQHLASLGYTVIAVSRNEQSLISLKGLHPSNMQIVVADITKNTDRFKIKSAIKPGEKGIILIHNAGIAVPQLLDELSEEHWDNHYQTNAKAPIFLTSLLMPFLRDGGRVLNVSTGLAHMTMPAMSAYGVSKSALFHWKEFCNSEYKNQGVLFSSAMPGIVDTRMQEYLRECDPKAFPATGVFKGFHDRNELLSPETVAKFFTWLVLESGDEAFAKGEWDIYDLSHRQFWAAPGEIKDRENKGVIKIPPQGQATNILNHSLFNSIKQSKYLTTAAISTATFVAGVLIARALCK